MLLWLLTLLDTLEVAVEMMSQRLFREPGKWAMVILMQTLRYLYLAISFGNYAINIFGSESKY